MQWVIETALYFRKCTLYKMHKIRVKFWGGAFRMTGREGAAPAVRLNLPLGFQVDVYDLNFYNP